MPVGNSNTTQILTAASDRARNTARLRVRQAAFRLAADCDHLLDELSQVDRPGWTQMLTQTLVATRQLVGLTGPTHDSASLFDAALNPSARLSDAHRRIMTASNVPGAVMRAEPGEEAMLSAIIAVREAAAQILSGLGGLPASR